MPKIYFDFIKKFTKLATNFHLVWMEIKTPLLKKHPKKEYYHNGLL